MAQVMDERSVTAPNAVWLHLTNFPELLFMQKQTWFAVYFYFPVTVWMLVSLILSVSVHLSVCSVVGDHWSDQVGTAAEDAGPGEWEGKTCRVFSSPCWSNIIWEFSHEFCCATSTLSVCLGLLCLSFMLVSNPIGQSVQHGETPSTLWSLQNLDTPTTSPDHVLSFFSFPALMVVHIRTAVFPVSIFF